MEEKWYTTGEAIRLIFAHEEAKRTMIATTQKPNYGIAQSRALGLLFHAGISVPPVNPISIAEEILKVPVRFVTFESSESERISGFYDGEDNVIVVNREEFPLRQTFTIAHELGHKVLHEEWARSSDYQVLLRNPLEQNRDFREKEADAFAANLLMPRFMMDAYYENLSHSELSRLFAVSVPAIKARLSFLYGI
jgi:Zn-dependent peptidase ImmA (M78 family)